MKKRTMICSIAAMVVFPIAYFGWQLTARAAYESAEYKVIKSDGMFEIREYPDLMLVTTPMRFEPQGTDGSFMRLFRYISGGNASDQKVAMTTPVFMDQSDGEQSGRMGFVMPKSITQGTVPEPADDQVQLRQREGGRFAVIRFAGRRNVQSMAVEEAQLRRWMVQQELTGGDEVEFAGYDPPMTPAVLRRNELLIRLND